MPKQGVDKLTGKRALFVQEYLKDLNITQAAKRAGYSEKSAHQSGYELMKKPEIQDAISKAMQKRSERTEITQDMVLQELARIGFSDIRKVVAWGDKPEVVGEDGELSFPIEMVSSSDVDDNTAAAISEVSLTAQGLKVKMADKLGALNSMGKHLGMFTDKVEHDMSDPLRDFFARVSDRSKRIGS